MGICYVLSESFYESVEKDVDPGEARRIIDALQRRKEAATHPDEILERKTYRGTKHVRQIRIGQWRIAALYPRGIDVAEVVQLCYLYNKNQTGEPNRDVLVAIDEAAEELFEDIGGMSPGEQSQYLSTMRTKFPDS